MHEERKGRDYGGRKILHHLSNMTGRGTVHRIVTHLPRTPFFNVGRGYEVVTH